MIDTVTERTTNVVAAGAVTSPWWIETIGGVSDVAQALLPILGAIWLIVQIIGYIIKHKREKD